MNLQNLGILAKFREGKVTTYLKKLAFNVFRRDKERVETVNSWGQFFINQGQTTPDSTTIENKSLLKFNVNLMPMPKVNQNQC